MNPASSLGDLARLLGEQLAGYGQMLATAESCTGGLVAKLVTDVAGSSGWFDRGLVTYSNGAKHELLGVPNTIFETHGAVSEACALAMARGLISRTPAHRGVSITGVAGPGGGSPDKPVGTVWIAWVQRGSEPQAQCFLFDGDRESVREQAAQAALQGLIERLTRGR